MADDKIGTVNDAVENASKLINKSGNDAVSQGLVSKKQDAALATVTKTKDSSLATVRKTKGSSLATVGRNQKKGRPAGISASGKAGSQAGRAGKNQAGAGKGPLGATGIEKQFAAQRQKERLAGASKNLSAGLGAAKTMQSDLDILTSDDGDEMEKKFKQRLMNSGKSQAGKRLRKAFTEKRKLAAGSRLSKKGKGISSALKKGSKIGKSSRSLAAARKAQKGMKAAARARRTASAVAKAVRAAVTKAASAASSNPYVLAAVAAALVLVIFITLLIIILGGGGNSNAANFSKLTSLEQPCAQFLKEKGLNTEQIAAIIGVWRDESNCNPRRAQDDIYDQNGNIVVAFDLDGDRTDIPEYPEHLIDNGQFGYGICQWTSPGRARGLVNFANSQGGSSGDRDIQLKYFWDEFTSLNNGSTYAKFKGSSDIDYLVDIFCQEFEVNAGGGTPKRHQYAWEVYELINSSSASDLVSWGREHLGITYHWGAQGVCMDPGGTDEEYDCSGFVCQALHDCGYDGPFGDIGNHETNTYRLLEIAESKWQEVSEDDIQDGDIIFFIYPTGKCEHVGIATSEHTVIEEAGLGRHDAVAREGKIWVQEGGYNRYFRPE